jgi:tetratricopeptide (TPR) repeat protein
MDQRRKTAFSTGNGRYGTQTRQPARTVFSGRNMTDGLRAAEGYFLGEAMLQYADGKLAKAMENFRNALHINPGNPQTHFYLGRACRRMNRADDAIAHLSDAIRLDPANAEAYKERGLARLQKRSGLWSDANAALGDFALALDHNSKDYSTFYYMAICRDRMWDWDVALSLLETYCELVPYDVKAAKELDIYRYQLEHMMQYHDRAQRRGTFTLVN